ncbi:MAG: SCP2 sterol-binding domain-containing protein [Candidatus Bathyarchaeia archaeon]|jgi:putative sterol carrier protein
MMEAKTPKEFFEKTLPARFKPDKARGIDVIAQLNLSGPNGGDWVVIIKNQELQVTEGTHPSPTLTLKMTENDFLNIVNEKLSAEKAFFTGKINFEGNISLALKLKDAGFL